MPKICVQCMWRCLTVTMTTCAQYLFIFLLTLLWQPIQLVGCYLPPTVLPECHCKEGLEGLTIRCTKLNSTSYLSHLHVDTAQAVVRVDIMDSLVDCVDLKDLERFHKLKHLKVTNSKLRHVLCPRPGWYRAVINNLEGIRTLDVSNNFLGSLDPRLESSTKLEQINLSNNEFYQLSPIVLTFTNLKSLDISNNQLSDTMDQNILENLPISLQNLDLTGRLSS